jgi:hypothetical protein
MARRQLKDLVARKGLLGQEDIDSLRHTLDLDHLKALTEFASKDDNVIRALENVVAVQTGALTSLEARSELDRQLSLNRSSNCTLISIDAFRASNFPL